MSGTDRSAAFLFAFLAVVPLSDAVADDAFFESKVRPLLISRCYECHSGTKTMGGLSLDTRDGWQKGGDTGPAIVPGKPGESLLIDAINYGSLEMPPAEKGAKLSAEEIAVLTQWVATGAYDPRAQEARLGGMSLDEAKSWWSFQPLPSADPSPSTANIDTFIQHALTANALAPAPIADKRTLIRRATFDLTGLPPTPQEVDAFLADDSVDAFANVVERLLASPQYGVHWGRHWLDVVRYADTAGENTDRPLSHAWRYRNWVFDAFNRDMRYDDFVRWQIAGDIVCRTADESQRSEGIMATGYLAIARRFGHDIDKDMYLTIEDVIDNLGKNFLGLTTGCARCHDHKYDPITAEDYYALYGIFESTRFAFPGCEPKGQPRDMVPLISPDQVEAIMKPWREQNAKAEAEKKRRAELMSAAQQAINGAAVGKTQLLANAVVEEGQSVNFDVKKIAVRKGEAIQLTVLPGGNHGADSTQVEWMIRESGGAERVWNIADLVQSLTRQNPHPDRDAAQWCFIEITPTGPRFLIEKADSIDGNSALKKWSNGDTPSVFVNASDQQVMVWTTLQAEAFFMHPGPDRPVAVAWISPFDGDVSITGRVADVHPAKLDGVSFDLQHIATPDYGPAMVALGGTLMASVVEVEPSPVIPVAYAVVEATAKNARFQQRGDPEKLGDEVPRRWLTVFGGDALSEAREGHSGREDLAQWIVSSPLAARVMANRIWEWHFGRGLVPSSNDFGARGDRPSNPELLDWLAAKFVEDGFSVKSMHRLIMNSATYQRASIAPTSDDPNNRLLAHFTRRRLTAEEMRDSLLAVSGQLDLLPAESHPFPEESTWTYTQHNPFNAVYETNKRSAYLMVQRQRRHPFLSLFDGADPNATTAARQTTTVPTQALYFLNDPFFHTQAAKLAESVQDAPNDEARLRNIYRKLLQRSPTQAEHEGATKFLNSYPVEENQKWSAIARILLASNEFVHVD